MEVITTCNLEWLYKDFVPVDVIHLYKIDSNILNLYKLAKKIKNCDLVIHYKTKLSLKHIFFLFILKAKWVAGIDPIYKIITWNFFKETSHLNISKKLIPLALKLNMKDLDTSYIIPRLETTENRIRHVWDNKNFIISFNPYGSCCDRQLSIENIDYILSFLKNNFPNIRVNLLFSPEFKQQTLEIHQKYKNYTTLYSESSHICDITSQIARSKALLTVDTSTIHIANGLNIPLFGFYHPDRINFLEWGPQGELDGYIFSSFSKPANVNLFDKKEFEIKLSRFLNLIINKYA